MLKARAKSILFHVIRQKDERRAVAAAVSLGLALLPLPALAQAWTREKGETRVIESLLYTTSKRGFDDSGRTVDIQNYDRLELYVLAEHGVTDDLTLLVTPSLRHVKIENSSESTGLGFVDVGARYRVGRTDRLTFAVQGLVRIPGQRDGTIPAQIGSTNTEFDVRGQMGASLGTGGSFAILEGGYRHRTGAPPDEVRIDATVGVRAAPRVLLIANSFNTISTGRGRGDVFNRRYRYHNAFLSAAYEVSPRVTLQLGATGTVAGRNALRERGFFAGAWLRF